MKKIIKQTKKADDESAFFVIKAAHDQSIIDQKDFYIDPTTGYQVMSAYFLKKRGYCCKNDCRHCPYKTDKT